MWGKKGKAFCFEGALNCLHLKNYLKYDTYSLRMFTCTLESRCIGQRLKCYSVYIQ